MSGPRPARRPRVTVVGDALLDVDWAGRVERVCPDAPAPVLEHESDAHRPGGAALAARFAAETGAAVSLVTALGRDEAGDIVRHELAVAGVELVDLGLDGPTPLKLRLRAAGQSLARVDRGCTPVLAPGEWTASATAAITGTDAVLVSDYGRGLAATPALGALLPGMARRVPVVWDPHVRGPRPPEGLDVLAPNPPEAVHLAGGPAGAATGEEDLRALADILASRFACAVALTAGGAGAMLARPGAAAVHLPVDPVAGDPCGAGDCFAATLAVARAHGTPVHDALVAALATARRQVAAGAPTSLVGEAGGHRSADRAALPLRLASGPTGAPASQRNGEAPHLPGAAPGAGRVVESCVVEGGAPGGRPAAPPAEGAGAPGADAAALSAAVRAAGGTVVAAGGCFDVLHAGHVRLLEAARRLGDCLVVCLNGDLSVRRLKGRHRPVNPVEDRAAVLSSLACVDAVAVFDEDTPCAALDRLRPHLFVKGADHADGDLPERAVMARWGGEVVFVPLVSGRSTTRILQAAASMARPPAG